MPKKIVSNKAKCRKCFSVIESKSVYDFVTCKCGLISVDGGLEYIRRLGELKNIEEMTVYEFVGEENKQEKTDANKSKES